MQWQQKERCVFRSRHTSHEWLKRLQALCCSCSSFANDGTRKVSRPKQLSILGVIGDLCYKKFGKEYLQQGGTTNLFHYLKSALASLIILLCSSHIVLHSSKLLPNVCVSVALGGVPGGSTIPALNSV